MRILIGFILGVAITGTVFYLLIKDMPPNFIFDYDKTKRTGNLIFNGQKNAIDLSGKNKDKILSFKKDKFLLVISHKEKADIVSVKMLKNNDLVTENKF